MILKIGIIVLIVLDLVFIFASWRLATYLCMSYKWILLIPIAQLVYFAAISDHASQEVGEGFKYLRYVVISLLLIVSCGICFRTFLYYDITELAGRLMMSLGTVFAILSVIYAFVNIAVNATEHSVIAGLCAMIIPFPIILLILSFTFGSYMEETILLYSEQ